MKVLIIVLLFFASSCHSDNDSVVITGDVKDVPDGKIYLTEAHRFRIHLDSAIVKDGKFRFEIKADSNFYPYLASLLFPNAKSPTGVTNIVFSNSISNGFYLERGTNRIVSDTELKGPTSPIAVVTVGKQNEVFLAFNGNFGGIGKQDDPQREKRIQFVKRQIEKYPYSYFLLDGINEWRQQYSNAELRTLLKMFDTDVQHSKLASKIITFVSIRPDDLNKIVNSGIIDKDGKDHMLVDASKRTNVIIFWASWCKPCREEIPELKKLHEYVKNDPGINMRSVSIDENAQMWKLALAEEKMTWDQGIIKEDYETIMTRYNFNGIPLILVIDNKLNLIGRFSGFDSTTLSKVLPLVGLHKD